MTSAIDVVCEGRATDHTKVEVDITHPYGGDLVEPDGTRLTI